MNVVSRDFCSLRQVFNFLLGGRIAEAYGAKYVMLTSVAGSAIINLATPWMARTSFALLVSSRILLGAIQSGVFPAMYALFNNWLTISEASIFAPLIKMNLRLGMLFGSALCGLMRFDWPTTFYTTGFCCLIWSIVWLFIATSSPEDNRWVSKAELDHINKKKKKQPKKEMKTDFVDIELAERNKTSADKSFEVAKIKESEKTPWLKICTSPSVIGLIIVKWTFNYALDFLIILLPSYLKLVFHAQPDTVSSSMGASLFDL